MTFYLKYRSQTIKELDITSVRESLEKIVAASEIPHAFLFAGPKGTGKTSAARILAKIVNCEGIDRRKKEIEPCNKCEQCKSITEGNNIDVIELDAASNRGIDDIRSIRDNIKLAPAKSRKKVYIIDEAHMLTAEASNALLKTLEEPPEHVMLILATTNPEKLIETIRSRTTVINFTKATPVEIARSLSRVVKGEKLKISDEILNLIASEARGSFRDATKILEQVVSQGESFLTKIKLFDADKFIIVLSEKDIKTALFLIEEFIQKGISADSLLESLLARFRLALLAKEGVGSDDLADFEKKDLIYLIELLLEASAQRVNSPIEQVPLELAIVEWCQSGQKLAQGKPEEIKTEQETPDDKKVVEVASDAVHKSNSKLKEIGEDVWKNILAQVRPINTSIEALLRAARPMDFDGKTLTLGVYYRFHKERLEENVHRKVLEDVVATILGNPVRVVCTLTDPPVKKAVEPPAAEGVLTEGGDQDIIKIAEEIFGN